jgi:hypothetical protein
LGTLTQFSAEDVRAGLAFSTSLEPSESNAGKNASTPNSDTQTKKKAKNPATQAAVESEYERTKRENITRNKGILAEILEREALEFPPKKGRGKGKGRKAPTR